jgi:hypothetical protein
MIWKESNERERLRFDYTHTASALWRKLRKADTLLYMNEDIQMLIM